MVVGVGVMGAWTALWLTRRGFDVLAVDLYGAGNSLSSSGDESRVIRSCHGEDDFYPRWVARAWEHWRATERDAGVALLHEVGALWFAHGEDGFEAASLETLSRLGVACERLEAADVARRFPVIAVDDVSFAVYEPRAGALMARRAVATVAELMVRAGGELRIGAVEPPTASDGSGGELRQLRLGDGRAESADAFVFACGPWLPKVFPALLSPIIDVTRQEVLYMAPPPGDARYQAGALPVWVDYDRAFYGIPSIEGRGFKLAPDWPGPGVDPDRQERRISDWAVEATRVFLARRFPGLADAPVAEGRVCQYETTADTHFVIDRHPDWSNAWILGGGSGHSFKHGPAIGEYASALVADDPSAIAELRPPDGRFAIGERRPGHGLRTSAAPPADGAP